MPHRLTAASAATTGGSATALKGASGIRCAVIPNAVPLDGQRLEMSHWALLRGTYEVTGPKRAGEMIPKTMRIAIAIAMAATLAVAVIATMRWGSADASLLERASWAATLVGPLLVLWGAFLIVAQLRESYNAVRAQLFDATATRIQDLNKTFLDNPELRPFFYEGKGLEGQPESVVSKALAVAEMHVDFFDTELLRRQIFPSSTDGFPSFDPWIRTTIRQSEPVCRILDTDAQRGVDGWYSAIHEYYADECAKGTVKWPRPAALSPHPAV